MSINEEALATLHQPVVERKQHGWDCHGERDMLPHMVVVFQDAGPIEAPLEGMMETQGNSMMAFRDRIAAEGVGQGVLDVFDKVMNESLSTSLPRNLGHIMDVLMHGGVPHVKSGDRLESVTLWADAWMQTGDADEVLIDGELPQRGDLQRSFEEDPSSTVTEALITTHYEDDLVGGVCISQMSTPYAISDGGVITFGESKIELDFPAEGALVDIMRPHFQDREVKQREAES